MAPYIYGQTGEPLPKLTKSSCKAGLTFNLPHLMQELLGIKTVLAAYTCRVTITKTDLASRTSLFPE